MTCTLVNPSAQLARFGTYEGVGRETPDSFANHLRVGQDSGGRINMREAHKLVLLGLKRLLKCCLRDGMAEVSPKLVDRRAVCAQAGRGGEIRADIQNADNTSAIKGPSTAYHGPRRTSRQSCRRSSRC